VLAESFFLSSSHLTLCRKCKDKYNTVYTNEQQQILQIDLLKRKNNSLDIDYERSLSNMKVLHDSNMKLKNEKNILLDKVDTLNRSLKEIKLDLEKECFVHNQLKENFQMKLNEATSKCMEIETNHNLQNSTIENLKVQLTVKDTKINSLNDEMNRITNQVNDNELLLKEKAYHNNTLKNEIKKMKKIIDEKNILIATSTEKINSFNSRLKNEKDMYNDNIKREKKMMDVSNYRIIFLKKYYTNQ
jgi:chromosome segregation ATPase